MRGKPTARVMLSPSERETLLSYLWCARYPFPFESRDEAAASCSCDQSVPFQGAPGRLALGLASSTGVQRRERDAPQGFVDLRVDASTAHAILCARRDLVELD